MFLDRLCRTAMEVALPNGEKVRVRVLSDTERRDVELHALRESALLVEKLRKEDSPEYQAILLPVRQGGAERIRESLVAYRRVVFIRESIREIAAQFIPFPDNATDAEKRDVLLRREAQTPELIQKRAEWVDKRLTEYRESLADKAEADLLQLFDKQAADGNANGLYQDEILRATVYYSTETPDGQAHYYASLEEVRGLPTSILTFLHDRYLEVDRVDPFLLPSPSVTESLTA